MFLPDNELDLGDVNNNDSITDEKKTKRRENSPIKWLLCESRNP